MSVIKKLAADSVPALAELEKECFGADAWSAEDIRDSVGNEYAAVYGLFPDCGIAAYAVVYNVAGDMQIASFAVAPSYRRRGFGKELMDFILAKAREEADCLSLEVRVSNLPAINLYKKSGFSVMCVRRGFYDNPPEDAYVMTYPEEKLR